MQSAPRRMVSDADFWVIFDLSRYVALTKPEFCFIAKEIRTDKESYAIFHSAKFFELNSNFVQIHA